MTNRATRIARRKLRFEYQYGILAEVGGSVRTSDNKGYYVRPQLSTGEYASPVRLSLAENAILKPYPGMSVKLIVDNTGNLVISGPNMSAIINQGINPVSLNPGDRPAWGLIRSEEIGNLYCMPHPTTSWVARVYPGYVQFGDTLVAFAGDDIVRLDSYKPSAGNHLYIGVFLNPSGALEAAASTEQSTSSDLGLSDLQECIDAATSNSIFVRAYQVAETDTDISQAASVDPRSLWSVSINNFVDLSDAPSSYTGQAARTPGVAGTEDQLVFFDTRRYLTAYNYNLTNNYRIGVAFGVDERNAQIVSEPAVGLGAGGAWDDEHVKDPKIARGALGVLYMYFSGSDNNSSGLYKIGLARSYDGGVTWTKYASNPVLSPEASGWETTEGASLSFPAVLYDEDEVDANKRWKMWYGGGKFGAGGIGYAYSSDGVSWTKYASNPVLEPTGTDWEQHLIYPGAIAKLGDTYYLFYNGYPTGDATGLAGLVTFTDPEGTYTRSANNPLVASDGITTTLTASVGVGDTTLAVTSATGFPIGAPVWVYDGTKAHYLSRVKSQASTTSLVLTDAAPIAISSTGGNVRSAAYNSINISGALYEDGWLFGMVAYQPGASGTGLKEISVVGYSKDLAAVAIDYGAGITIPITASESTATNVARENPEILKLKEIDKRRDRIGITQEEGDARYTLQSLFDADTVLTATSDNTPIATTLTEQTVLGRVTGGHPAAIAIDNDLSSVSANHDTIPSAKATKDYIDSQAGGAIAAYEDGVSVVATADKFDFRDAFDVVDAGSNDAAIYLYLAHIFQARLTLETGVAVSTTDQTAKTTIYLTKHKGNKISVYDGTRQRLLTLGADISIKLTDTQTGTTHNGTAVIDGLTDTSQLAVGMEVTGTGVGAGANITSIDSGTQVTVDANSTADGSVSITFKCPADTAYDVWVYSNSGTLKLEMLAWTNVTTRATALTSQDGVEVKTGDTTRRYAGSFCTTATAGQTEMTFSSPSSILLWNRYNRIEHKVRVIETADSWIYNAAGFTFRSWNNSDTNRFKCVVGLNDDPVKLSFSCLHSVSTGGIGQIGIGLDSTSAQSADVAPGSNSTSSILTSALALYNSKPGIGYHYFQCLECSNSSVNITFYGDIGVPTAFQGGMSGTFWG
jgi:predicted GH43/DUF377 family glycosyl hydrolase